MRARGTSCRSSVHDWPLPTNYIGAANSAEARLAAGWDNIQCVDCKLYGWVPPDGFVELSPVFAPPEGEPS